MAKRTAARRAKAGKKKAKPTVAPRRRAPKAAKRPAKRQASAKKKSPAKKASKKVVSRPARKVAKRPRSSSAPPEAKVARLDRTRKILDDDETLRTPPSSLDMDRRGSAARSGRAEIAESVREHHGMNSVNGGDPDVDVEDAYFTGEEAPGGDNPTPDQDIVDDIGKALGVTYEDNEELKASDKVVERDKHRWELDPASAEDYTDHDKD
jgi:hypothetical protein